MSRYNLRLRYNRRLPISFAAPQLTAEVLGRVLPVGTPYSLTPLTDGYELAVDLKRRDHDQAMAELDSAFAQLGLNVLRATIIEFTSSWIEGGVIGTGGGALVGAATKSIEGFLALSILGFVLGALTEHEKAQYLAVPTAGGWEITRRESPPANGPELAY